jgi:dienelactone hydrolase
MLARNHMRPRALRYFGVLLIVTKLTAADPCESTRRMAEPPAEYANSFGSYQTLLRDAANRSVTNQNQWQAKREEIRSYWDALLGPWPPLLPSPKLEIIHTEDKGTYTEKRVRVEIASGQFTDGYLLVPAGKGPFPAVLVPFYEPETSIGRKGALRDFGLQLARRGFVTLSIGSPGGDARKPPETRSQPLYFLAYVAANCRNALAALPNVDGDRVGVVGHSYGGKWAMFAACFNERFACGVWSDPGIVFDEKRSNVNYWEPWYLGFASNQSRKPGLVTAENPRTGAYQTLVENKHDLTEVLALMAPRPFLVSGGSEDTVERWQPLNRVREVYQLRGRTDGVALTLRPKHDPTEESNEQVYGFFECFLKRKNR